MRMRACGNSSSSSSSDNNNNNNNNNTRTHRRSPRRVLHATDALAHANVQRRDQLGISLPVYLEAGRAACCKRFGCGIGGDVGDGGLLAHDQDGHRSHDEQHCNEHGPHYITQTFFTGQNQGWRSPSS